jgi:hypothetical protein
MYNKIELQLNPLLKIRKILLPNTSPITHTPKQPPTLIKRVRSIQFHNPPIIHNTDAIIINNRLQPMRDAKQSLAFEPGSDGALNLFIRFHVNR